MGLKRTRPIQRGGRLQSRGSKARTTAKRERNFGEEADRVRAMPCLVAQVVSERSRGWLNFAACSGSIVAAHVTARGMGGAKGGRFDIVPLCDVHHGEAGEAPRPGEGRECRECDGDGGELRWDRASGEVMHAGDCPECKGTGHALSQRAAFEALYGLQLRAEADRIALEHPAPLGIRGLAARFAFWFGDAPDCRACGALKDWPDGECSNFCQPCADVRQPDRLEGYDLEALLGWVRRWADGRGPSEHDLKGAENPRDILATDLADDLHIEDDAAFALLVAAGAFEGLPT